MMKYSVALVLLTVALVQGTQIRDDSAEMKALVPKTADKDYDAFVTAVEKGDFARISQLLGDLVSTISSANENNDKVIPTISKMIARIQTLADDKLTSWLGRGELRLMVKLIDGNRDNKSYYTLDAARAWIEKRLNATAEIPAPLSTPLQKIRDLVVKGRDALDSCAQNFVNGIKNLVVLTNDSKENAEAIRAQATNMTVDFRRADQLTGNTTQALKAAQDLQNFWRAPPAGK